MRILSLPDLPAFTAFPTIGPDGESVSDINGRAAAIECYLDLDDKAQVRWTAYNPVIGAYQGELDGKTRYMRAFLQHSQRRSDYDYSRIEQVLSALIASAASISEPEVSREWQRAFEGDVG
jgi:hypothetical protein